MNLICFPWAGGGCSAFHKWQSGLPDWIQVIPVVLPGRERRMREPSFYDIDQLLDAMVPALEPLFETPYSLFGHSMGALISFALLRRLRRQGSPMAAHLFVSGQSAPQAPVSGLALHNLPPTEFKKELSRLAGTPAEVLDNPELFEFVSASMRGDLSIAETYKYRAEPPIDVPITAFGGAGDKETTAEGVQAWGAQTTCSFSMHMMPGDHFFLRAERESISKIIESRLCELSSSRVAGFTFQNARAR